jgi:hypothetical protein
VEASGKTATCSSFSVMELVLWVFLFSEVHTDFFWELRDVECHIGQSDM